MNKRQTFAKLYEGIEGTSVMRDNLFYEPISIFP